MYRSFGGGWFTFRNFRIQWNEGGMTMDPKDQKAIRQLLGSPQGQQLLRLLSKDGGTALKQAGAAVQQGDQAEARNILAPMLQDPEVQKLLAALEKSMNHG